MRHRITNGALSLLLFCIIPGGLVQQDHCTLEVTTSQTCDSCSYRLTEEMNKYTLNVNLDHCDAETSIKCRNVCGIIAFTAWNADGGNI